MTFSYQSLNKPQEPWSFSGPTIANSSNGRSSFAEKN